ncbi:hypothetical protein SAMD00019534_095910, partial [Acytostelium subglobosum LB1]|uniref:hypothetical protein n=1 Tax=Acytostelium subglobosum LB1 TaxID=1410327 RepID=UPI000644B581
MFATKLIILSLLVSMSLAHLCIFEPEQREPTFAVPIQPGDGACYRPYSNCGNVTAGAPVAFYTAGSTAYVHFQQNYNHWYQPNQGFMDVAISYNGDQGPFQVVSKTIPDYNAWDMVSQTNYTVSIQVPNQTCKGCVLRVRYISNNAGEPLPDFYQCADIAIQ